jgi:hypothetical protein
MGDAAYPDDWVGWQYEGRNPNSRVHPEGVGGWEWDQPTSLRFERDKGHFFSRTPLGTG